MQGRRRYAGARGLLYPGLLKGRKPAGSPWGLLATAPTDPDARVKCIWFVTSWILCPSTRPGGFAVTRL